MIAVLSGKIQLPSDQDPRAALLAQMRDLQLPETPGWWPLAPGWWILIIIALAVLAALIWTLIAYRRRNRYRHLALSALAKDDSRLSEGEKAASILTILRRVFIKAYPSLRPHSNDLYGGHWVQLLSRQIEVEHPLPSHTEINNVLYCGANANHPATIERLRSFAECYIKKHPRSSTKTLDQLRALLSQTEAASSV